MSCLTAHVYTYNVKFSKAVHLGEMDNEKHFIVHNLRQGYHDYRYPGKLQWHRGQTDRHTHTDHTNPRGAHEGQFVHD